MITRGASFGEMSGSLGGVTASRNKGGQYLRKRVTPVNPSSVAQQDVRATFSVLTAAWSVILSNAQRTSWGAFAAALTIPNAFGVPITISPLACYIRNNALRMQCDFASVDAAPSDALDAILSPVAIVADSSANTLSVAFNDADTWATEVGGGLAVFCSPAQTPTINNYSGRMNFMGFIAGDVVPPTTPEVINVLPLIVPFPIGSKVFIRCTAFTADGRISADQKLTITIVA